jgi:hypothetical protein
MPTKSFDKWDTDEIESVFGLRRAMELPLLQAWTSSQSGGPDATTTASLEALRLKLLLYVNGWNEEEIKFRFIAPLINLVDFDIDEHNIHAFSQRTITAVVNDVKLTGRVDFMLATGKTKPIRPFFFLHEYKKERGSRNDPRAQLLAEMLAARELNSAQYPMYGCYVVGRNWFFLVLEGSMYAESDVFVATQEDIYQIFAILREAKAIIGRLAEKYT